jgi:hypothetical protein
MACSSLPADLLETIDHRKEGETESIFSPKRVEGWKRLQPSFMFYEGLA